MGACLIVHGFSGSFSSIFSLTVSISHSFLSPNASKRTYLDSAITARLNVSIRVKEILGGEADTSLAESFLRLNLQTLLGQQREGTFPEAFRAQLADC